MRIATNDKDLYRFLPFIAAAQCVLFEFRTPLASHFARSPSNHSYGYASSGDRTNCLASDALILEPFMQYAG